jgi:hypothetical protein
MGLSEIIVVIRFAASVIVLVRYDQGRLENRRFLIGNTGRSLSQY